MSLLDDLKKQAQAQLSEDREQREAALREALYQNRFCDPMQRILRYLGELIEQLKILDYKVYREVNLPGIGVVKALRQSDYAVNVDSSDAPKLIRLRFKCDSDQEREFAVVPRPKAEETRQFLDSQAMRYAEWPIRNHDQQIIGLNFQLAVSVKVDFVFQVDLEMKTIKMFISNFNDFKTEKSLLVPERVNDLWLDNLGNYLLRKRADLYDLDMDEGLRQSLRERLLEEDRQRQQELQQALLRENTQRGQEVSPGLFGRLRSLAERRGKKPL
ncbi:MAG: hypothetical protein ABW076_16460 [Candidatus Thiodiazotropha sp.]